MVQFQKPKKVYNDRHLFFGGSPGIPGETLASLPTSGTNADRRSSRSRGSYIPPGPSNGSHEGGMHPTGYPMPCAPLPHYHGIPAAQPYAIPTRGAVHGPVGGLPHGPQPGSRGFGAGRGSAGAPIGSHLSNHQGSQQPIGGSLGSNFNFPPLESPNSQPSVVRPLSQPGYVSSVPGWILYGWYVTGFPRRRFQESRITRSL